MYKSCIVVSALLVLWPNAVRYIVQNIVDCLVDLDSSFQQSVVKIINEKVRLINVSVTGPYIATANIDN